MDLALKFLGVICAFSLTFMGVWVSLDPIKPHRRKQWLFAFATIGLVSVCLAILQSERQDAELDRRLTGGDNYVFLIADSVDLAARRSSLRTWICSTGHMFDVKVHPYPFGITDPNDPAYTSMNGGIYNYVGKGCRWSGILITPGKFSIELESRNGLVRQHLEIQAPPDGAFKQKCALPRNGEYLLTDGCPPHESVAQRLPSVWSSPQIIIGCLLLALFFGVGLYGVINGRSAHAEP